MATNRLSTPNVFAGLNPPWILANLDANSNNVQGALNDSSLGFVNGIPIDTGSANLYQIVLPIGMPSSYNAGFTVAFIAANSNNGPSTLTVSPLGSQAIVNMLGGPLQNGDIVAGCAYVCISNGTQFYLLNAPSSNVAGGQFAVTPGSGVSVQINRASAVMVPGVGVSAGNLTPATVALAVPGSNSYYASVYWDDATNTYGAVYSTPSATPLLSQATIPDSSTQRVIAFVLLASTTTQVTSAMITPFTQRTVPLLKAVGSIGAGLGINCFGASDVVVVGSLTQSANISLTNLQQGIPVHIILSSTGTNGVTVTAARPSGAPYTVVGSNSTFNFVTWSITAEVVSASMVLQAISLGGTSTGLYFLL